MLLAHRVSLAEAIGLVLSRGAADVPPREIASVRELSRDSLVCQPTKLGAFRPTEGVQGLEHAPFRRRAVLAWGCVPPVHDEAYGVLLDHEAEGAPETGTLAAWPLGEALLEEVLALVPPKSRAFRASPRAAVPRLAIPVARLLALRGVKGVLLGARSRRPDRHGGARWAPESVPRPRLRGRALARRAARALNKEGMRWSRRGGSAPLFEAGELRSLGAHLPHAPRGARRAGRPRRHRVRAGARRRPAVARVAPRRARRGQRRDPRGVAPRGAHRGNSARAAHRGGPRGSVRLGAEPRARGGVAGHDAGDARPPRRARLDGARGGAPQPDRDDGGLARARPSRREGASATALRKASDLGKRRRLEGLEELAARQLRPRTAPARMPASASPRSTRTPTTATRASSPACSRGSPSATSDGIEAKLQR